MYIYIYVVHGKVPYYVLNLYVVVPWDMRRKSIADVSPENIICARIYRQYSYFCTRKQILLYQ